MAVGGDQVADFADQRQLAMRWDGKTWKATAQPVKTNATLESVAFGTAANVWAVGEDRTDLNKTTGTPAGSGNRSTPASRSRSTPASSFVTAPASNARTGTLTAIAAKDRTWAVGMTATSTSSPFAALAAYSR